MKASPRAVGYLLFLAWLSAPAPTCANQAEIDAIVTRVEAGFQQTFDGKNLRRWQETYQNACLKEIPRLARLLQEEGTDLPHDPYGQHRNVLRQTLPKMEDKHMQAMDLHVQLSQKWLSLPSTSSQAGTVRAQMSEQEKTVKLYDSIVATLRERLTYLDKCARLADKSFADAARERQSLAANRSTRKTPHGRPTAPLETSIAMPTGVPSNIDYDPKKGLSIGIIGQQEPVISSGNVAPPPPASTTANHPAKVAKADVDVALRQAAQACKDQYNRAYNRMLERRRKIIEEAHREIPKLEACISEKRQEKSKWEQRQRLAAPNDTLVAQLRRLEQEKEMWLERARKMGEQAAKLDAYNKWEEASQKATLLEQEIATLQQIGNRLQTLEQQKVECEVNLQLMREKVANAEKVLNGESLERTIAAHRAKRFAEIEQLLRNGNLSALQQCAAQGYLELDDLMRELYH